jgi:signal transduction histidine kinase
VPDFAAALTPPTAAVDVATGLVLAAAGVVALRRGRGPLLLVAGVAWLAGDVWSELAYAHRGPLVHLLLGRSAITALAYADGLIPSVASAPWPTIALAAAIVLTAARRRRPGALAGAVAVSGALVCAAVGEITDLETGALGAWWYDVAVAGVAVVYALSPRSRAAASVAADLVVDLGAEPRALRAALARAIGDPTLDVAYRAGGGWVDETGRVIELPAAGSGRTVRVIDDRAALVHDPAALRDAELAESVDAALRLAVANVRLQADVSERVREVEQSRRRLVEAGDAERRRVREQIETGAERQLAAADAALAPAPDAGALRADLGAARDYLVLFAEGVHPPALGEQGVAGALRELVSHAAAPVALEATPERFDGPVETAAFFVCSEALANAAKYAPGARVRIVVSALPGALQVLVEDDGPGGADPRRGSGLRGLADRVEALGGRLEVDSRPGAGTRLTALLPLAGPPPAPAEPALVGSVA